MASKKSRADEHLERVEKTLERLDEGAPNRGRVKQRLEEQYDKPRERVPTFADFEREERERLRRR